MSRACLLIACAFALALAGCSSSSDSSAGGTTASGESAAASGTTSSSSGNTTGGSGSTEGGGSTAAQAPDLTFTVVESALGTILAAGNGHTVYLFTPDKKNKSVCTGPCTADWPPLPAKGEPTLGDGVDSSLVAVIKRPDGSKQLSYAGHPLYTFSGDANAGDVNGQSVGGVWFAIAPDGQKAG